MDPTSYHYNDDVKDTELEEDYLVVSDVPAIGVDYHFSCDICKIRLASIFQQEGNYCLECWQERTHPSL
ncbi:MAG: hypothetical protein WCC17_21095 [Candidatus Nitrosopolaris sp.]|jgi:hypothetical protein